MQNKTIHLEFSHNSQAQYARGNSIVFSGIPKSIEGEYLENIVSLILSDIDITVELIKIEDYHRFDKSNSQIHSDKTIIHFVNRKN